MRTTTIAVQIGNSDDKLTQKEWADFVAHTDSSIRAWALELYFHGVSDGAARWQNAAWIFSCANKNIPTIKEDLRMFCQAFRQDSIAWSILKTEFLS